jgi:hypothetical protein
VKNKKRVKGGETILEAGKGDSPILWADGDEYSVCARKS